MPSSLLATDKYKMVMAQAGAALREETFVFMIRRGGPFYLPVDVPAYVEALLPRPDEADLAWLAAHGMPMDGAYTKRKCVARSMARMRSSFPRNRCWHRNTGAMRTDQRNIRA